MAAHKIKAIARAEDGSDVTVFPLTIASQVVCTVPDESATGGIDENGEQPTTQIPLDELLNQYADEINENTAALVEHDGQLELLTTPNSAVCDTAGNVPAKTVNISPFVLTVFEEVTVQFTNANTALSATLNVSSSGAKPIMYKGQPLSGGLLSGVQKFSYDGTNWNVIGDFDTNTDTTYDIMSVVEALTGSEITPRTVNALNFKQAITNIASAIVEASLADSYDVAGLQAQLNNLIFQLAAAGIIDGNGLDTVVTIDDISDIVLVSGIYADGKVYV
jgi:hypothetical protein